MRKEMFSHKAALRLSTASLSLVVLMGLPACSSIKNALGMTKHKPDEFAVVTKAPLVVPPDFSLRPPRAGALGPNEETPVDTAKQTVFGVEDTKVAAQPGQSAGEVALLENAGAAKADPQIRSVVAAENRGAEAKQEGFVDKVMFWDDKSPKPDPVVDPEAEAVRIRTAAQAGQPIAPAEPVTPAAADASTATPSATTATEVKPEKKGLLSRLWPF